MKPIKEWGEECGKQALAFMDTLDERLATSTYIAGERFSIADIIALCTLDFARVVKLEPGENHVHLRRWHELVSNRSSAKA